MKGRAAIRIIIISTLYAVLYFAYTLFSLQGTMKGISTQWPSFLFISGICILGGFALHLALARIREILRERSGRSIQFVLSGSLTVMAIMLLTLAGGFLYKYIFLGDLMAGELNEIYPGIILHQSVL